MGTDGEAGVFSFNNNKIVTTFGAGALVTNREDIYQKALLLARQAVEKMPYYVGYTYRMGPLNAALGLHELGTLKERDQPEEGDI